MKRIACMAIVAAVSLMLAGCGGTAAPSKDEPADQSAQSQQEATQGQESGEQEQADSTEKTGQDAEKGGSESSESDGDATGEKDKTATTSVVTGKKWQYAYPGDESPYLAAVCEYLGEYDAEYFDIADGMIPAAEIVRVDDSDANDIKVFGVFEIRNYTLKNKVLQLESGGTMVGVIHVAPDGDGYKPTKTEFAEDGAGYDTSLEEICKGYEGLYDDMMETVVPDKVRKLYMEECIDAFDLDVEKYQDIGEDPMPIDEWLSYSFD